MEKHPNDARAKVLKINDQKKSKIAFDQKPSPDIFKLHAIACSDLFDYLSFDDIYSMGQTCKRFNRIAGNYFQVNYSTAETFFAKNGQILHNGCSINEFSQYVQNISIDVDQIGLDGFKYIASNCKSLKKIEIDNSYNLEDKSFDGAKIDCIKEILAKIENITLNWCCLDNVYETILKYCPNLKRMAIENIYSENTEWLHQKYAMLEHVSILYDDKKMEDCKVFLEQNPNIRSLSCEAGFLIENENWLLTTTAKLHYLDIEEIDAVDLSLLCSLLNQLHGREFYKKLRLHTYYISQDVINRIGQLSTVERLCIYADIRKNYNIPVMADVKEMSLDILKASDLNIEEFVTKFPNVERVHLQGVRSFNQMVVMIKRCEKLRELNVSWLKFEVCHLNLWALNKEREKLSKANKVTIYLNDSDFLSTKWTFNDRDFKFVEIKRFDSGLHDF